MTHKLTLFTTGALAADLAKRTLTGLLLPYNEEGKTNLGRLTVPPGVLHAAAEALPFYDGHKGPLAGSFTHEETPQGVRFVASIFPGEAGDALLASGKECVSVEVDPINVRAGKAISGVMTGAAAVEEGAFPSARLAAEGDPVVPDTEPEVPDFQTVYEGDLVPVVKVDGDAVDGITKVTVSDKEIDITTSDPGDDGDEIEDVSSVAASATKEEPKMTAAKVQNAALVASKTEPKDDMNALFAAVAAGFAKGLTGNKLEAALSDIVPGDILGVEQPQYVGQLWDGVPYERRFIPLFNHADLSSFTIKGWQWADGKRPEVDLYAGDKADIPSGDVETVEASGVLQRFAGGHDIDRKFRDFSNSEFWDAYFKALAESYAKKSDRYIRDQVKAIPTAGNGQRVHLLNAAMPDGVPKALAMIVKGAIKMMDDLETLPTFAMVTSDWWEELFYVPREQVLAYLSTNLELKEGEVSGFKIVPVPTGSLTVSSWVGKVLIGHKQALTVHELPGSPIRVEAEAIAKGGIDEALFGYAGYLTENVKGLVAYDAPTAS